MDQTCAMVAEFHEAFDCYAASQPELPELTEADRADLESTAKIVLHRVSKILNSQAAKRDGDPGRQVVWTRLQLIQEELAELGEALAAGDLVAVLDALCDLQYVVDGAFLSFGLGKLKLRAVAEVHRSNMTKLGDDGRPVISESGRVVKGPQYQPPQLRRFLSPD